MSEVKKKIIINHEHLKLNSEKKSSNSNGSSGSRGRPGRTLKKMPRLVRPSELKNNLIKLLKQKREENQQEKQQDKSKDQATQGNSKANPTDALQQPSPMHACDHCGVHLPDLDMVQGRSGRYCSETHRQAAGDQAT